MKFEDEQKRRALNLIWNVAEDYTIEPDIKVYDERGNAQLYWNSIIGAIYRHYDMERLHELLVTFQGQSKQELYESLYWIALEQASYDAEVMTRPALQQLRHEYARELMDKGRMLEESSQQGERLEWMHFCRVLEQKVNAGSNKGQIRLVGLEEPESEIQKVQAQDLEMQGHLASDLEMQELDTKNKELQKTKVRFLTLSSKEKYVLEALENLEVSDTEQLICKIQEVLTTCYGYKSTADRTGGGFLQSVSKWLEKIRPKAEVPPIRRFAFGYGEYLQMEDDIHEQEKRRRAFQLPVLSVQTQEGLQQYIHDYFGRPLYHQGYVEELEKKYCQGTHKFCHLHFTKGGYEDEKLSQGYAGMRKRSALEQIERNKAWYQEHQDMEYQAILRLTNRIRNTLLAQLDSYEVKANNGQIAADRIWRGLHLEDNKVFNKERKGSESRLSVDLLLDASVSQLHRQETVASQGYILAESLTRCQIPVRVYSFCSMSGYTIINQFRDYEEIQSNDNLFNYFTSGCNRDGLAVRIAAGMLQDTPYENKLLVILTDVKPNDVLKINTERNVYHDYADSIAVDDVAREVHTARLHGISIVCVFTGKDEDLDNARKIYGRGLARIHSMDQFADTVGVVLQNEIEMIY